MYLLNFSRSLGSIVNVFDHTKYVSLNNQSCMTQPSLIYWFKSWWIQPRLHYCPFMVNLDICNGSCNSLDDPPDKICVPSKAEDMHLRAFNVIARINELQTLARHISCECKCKFDGRKCNSNQKWNNESCNCGCKNLKKIHVCEKDYICNPSTCTFENGNYLESIVGDSVITCNEIIEVTNLSRKLRVHKFKRKNVNLQYKNFLYFYILSITMSLLIIVSIYCYLIKHIWKRKHFTTPVTS